jgi:uncharacterized protein YdaL
MFVQVTDYAERVSRPGDFATLRQKNKDGMYTALEQFEVSFLAHLTLIFILISVTVLFSILGLSTIFIDRRTMFTWYSREQ